MKEAWRQLAPVDPRWLRPAQAALVILVIGGLVLALRVQIPTQLSGPAIVGADGALSAHVALSPADRVEPGMSLEFTSLSPAEQTVPFTITEVAEAGDGVQVRARPAGPRASRSGLTGTATVQFAPRSLLAVLTSALAHER